MGSYGTGGGAGLQELFGLGKPPIAIGFFDTPPVGVAAWSGDAVPAGCAFWKMAQEGRTFYTQPSDHFNCAVGAHTHKIALPEERAHELGDTVGFMIRSGYIAMEEIPGIPTLRTAPAVIAYAPAESAPFAPSVVLIAAQPAQAMLLYEAALQAGAGAGPMPALGRPGCAVLPLALETGVSAFSLGCKGNRTFTGLPDSEMYVCIPGDHWAAVVEHAEKIAQANAIMAGHYSAKQTEFEGVDAAG